MHNSQPVYRDWAVRLLLALTLAALAGCASAGTPAPTAADPPASELPEPTLTPTPAPNLVIAAEQPPALADAVRQWAEGRGWGTINAAPSEIESVLTDHAIDPVMVVSFGLAIDPGERPAVLVEVEGAAPAAAVSTVGAPGARYDQAGFLAGVMAGLISQTEWVGDLTSTGGGPSADDQSAYLAGFGEGLAFGCPRCRRVSLTLGEASVDGYRGQGVDVVFVVPDPETAPVAIALAEAGIWVVWIGDVPPALPAASIAGRVGFAMEPLLFNALDALAAGEAGQAWPYLVQNGGLALADLNEQAISPGRQRLLLEAYQALADGELAVGGGASNSP